MISGGDAVAVKLAELIQTGDVAGLEELLTERPSLASERFGDDAASRTALHIATDWPGHFPRVADTISILINAGAAVNGRHSGSHRETPLHWAASSDDVDAMAALLAAGADIEADGAVHTNGTPLSDAVVFAQWKAARMLVDRGATMTIWQAAALDEIDALKRHLTSSSPGADEITNACWHACRAGRLAAAQLLVAHGADLEWRGHDDLTSRQAGLASQDRELISWLETREGPAA